MDHPLNYPLGVERQLGAACIAVRADSLFIYKKKVGIVNGIWCITILRRLANIPS